MVYHCCAIISLNSFLKTPFTSAVAPSTQLLRLCQVMSHPQLSVCCQKVETIWNTTPKPSNVIIYISGCPKNGAHSSSPHCCAHSCHGCDDLSTHSIHFGASFQAERGDFIEPFFANETSPAPAIDERTQNRTRQDGTRQKIVKIERICNLKRAHDSIKSGTTLS